MIKFRTYTVTIEVDEVGELNPDKEQIPAELEFTHFGYPPKDGSLEDLHLQTALTVELPETGTAIITVERDGEVIARQKFDHDLASYVLGGLPA